MAKKNKSIIQHQNTDSNGEVTITTDYGAELVIESPVEEDPITGEISKKKEFVGYDAVTGKEVYL